MPASDVPPAEIGPGQSVKEKIGSCYDSGGGLPRIPGCEVERS